MTGLADRYGTTSTRPSKGLVAVVVVLIGAGLALLFAPQTGSELRGVLRNYASRAKDDMMERGREAWDTAVERGKEYMERGQETLQEAGRSAREYAQSGQEKLKEAGKEAASKFKDAGREAANRM